MSGEIQSFHRFAVLRAQIVPARLRSVQTALRID